MQTTKGTAADSREAVRMYPNNSLKEPVRPFEKAAFKVVRSNFSK